MPIKLCCVPERVQRTSVQLQKRRGTPMQHNDSERLLSRAEVQDRFGIGQRFLADAHKRGEGPRLIRVGRLIRYRVQDVRAWIEAQASDEVTR